MNKNEVGLWDSVMVEFHKINISHDVHGVDMMYARIDGVGVREMDMRLSQSEWVAMNPMIMVKFEREVWPVNATPMYPLLVDTSPWSSISDRCQC